MTEIQEMAEAIKAKHGALWPLTWAVADFMAKQLAGDQGYIIVNQLTHELMGLNTQQAEISTTKHKPHCLLLDPEEPQCHCSCGLEPAPEPRDKRIRPSYLDQAVIDRVAESSARHLEEIGRRLAEPAPAQDDRSPEQLLTTEQIHNIARKVHGECCRLPGSTFQHAAEAAVMYALERIARPAQTEQQPVAWRRVVERLIANVEIFDQRPRPMCRDCADCNGVCDSGLDCDIRGLVEEARAMLAAPIAQTEQPEQSEPNRRTLQWVVDRWHAEVANRPLVNVHRRTLDSTWRQMIRHLGEDDVVLLGPRHDDMLDASGNPLPQYAAPIAQTEQQPEQDDSLNMEPEGANAYLVGEPDLALFSRLLPGLNAMIRGKPSHAFRAFQIGRFAGAVAAEHDASRWKALRAMHWHESPFAVVRNPKQQVKLGTDCPSGDRLDELMDAFIVSQARP